MLPNDKPIDILGIGVTTLDILFELDSYPAKGSVARSAQRKLSVGGGVSIACLSAHLLGANVELWDTLGDDPIAKLIREECGKHRFSTVQMSEVPESSSSLASILVESASGERTIVFNPGTAPELAWSPELAEKLAKTKILHVNGRHLKTAIKAAEQLKKEGGKLSYDGGAHRYREEIKPLFMMSDIVIVSKHFAEAAIADLLGLSSSSTAELAEMLFRLCQPELVVVTDGERGSWLFTDDVSFHQKAVPSNEVKDTTGCGDIYHGAFLFALVNSFSLENCALFATKIASENTKGVGALAVSKQQLSEITLAFN